MNDECLVSVIVPVYNVEKYLERCLKSVLRQTYKNLEIILVDDGSKDLSGKICDSWEKKEKRIKVIHKKNGGLASARNEGVKLSNGKYLIFVDSDDWIALDTIEYCLQLLDRFKLNADIVQYNILETSIESYEIKKNNECINILTGKEILDFLMKKSTKSDSYFSACRCLYRTSLIKNVPFVEGKINEDISWKFKVLSYADSMIDSNQIKYFYFQGSGSITTDGLKMRDFDLYDAANELVFLAKDENYGDIYKLAVVKKARTPLSLLCKIAFWGISDSSLDEDKVISDLVAELKKNLSILLKSPIPLSRKVLAVMMSLNFRITKVFVRLVKRFL